MTRKERVINLLNNKPIDRPPIYDLLRNDAALGYYSKDTLTLENARETAFRAASAILDATRPLIKFPMPDGERILPGGRKQVTARWTTWTEPLRFPDAADYEIYLRKNRIEPNYNPAIVKAELTKSIEDHLQWAEKLGETFLFWSFGVEVGLMTLHTEVGLDQFSYFLYDCPEAISEALEAITEASLEKIKLAFELTKQYPERPAALFIGEDLAFKTATMFSPAFFRREFFPRLKRITEACHAAGWKVMFHSDGYLMDILDGLVDAGIDVLNPIEVAAGMDIKEIHRRYPDLILAGGIDVSQLLPFGKPAEIKDAVIRAIEDAEGKIMVGSSTELQNEVPLTNVLALYDSIRDYHF